jgi:hypothetical protein
VTKISPSHGGDDGFVTITLTGHSFDNTLDLYVENDTNYIVHPLALRRRGIDTICATFAFAGAPHGIYDIVIPTGNGTEERLYHTFTVESRTQQQVSVTLGGPNAVRQGGTARYSVTLKNLSNVDEEYVAVVIRVSKPGVLSLASHNFTIFGGGCSECYSQLVTESQSFSYTELILSPGLFPQQEVELDFAVEGVSSNVAVSTTIHSVAEEELNTYFVNYVSDLRRLLINTASVYDTLVSLATDSVSFTSNFIAALAEGGVGGFYDFSAPRLKSNGITGDILLPQIVYPTIGFGACWYITLIFAPSGVGAPIGIGVGLSCAIATAIMQHMLTCDPSEFRKAVAQQICLRNPRGTDSLGTSPLSALDPNEKLGPTGPGGANTISLDQQLQYSIYFENVATASAPALDVTVTDKLDNLLDWRKFRLSEVAWGDTTIIVPGSPSYWHGTVDLDSLGLLLEIDAGINASTGEAHWYFKTIDPATGQPPVDPFAGFLPPNDSTGRGQGHVSFIIKADPTLPEGTEIKNDATIVFDINDPIVTNEVVNVVYQSRPDLVVSSSGIDTDSLVLSIGASATIEATVENSGEIDAASFYVKLFLERQPGDTWVLVDSLLVDGLTSGQAQAISFDWTPSQAMEAGQLHICADYDNVFEELDDANNNRTVTVLVSTFLADIDGDGFGPDVADLLYLVDYKYRSGPPPPLGAVADIDCVPGIDIADVAWLVNYMFNDDDPPCDPTMGNMTKQNAGTVYSGTCELLAASAADNRYTMAVWGTFDTEVCGVEQTYSYDPESVTVDSVVAGSANKGVDLFHSAADGRLILGMVDLKGKERIKSSRSNLVNIYFHANEADTVPVPSALVHVNTVAVDSDARHMNVSVTTAGLWQAIPRTYSLSQNYPNPFNPSTTIAYGLPKPSQVKLTIFNILGQTVVTLVNQMQPAGHYKVEWNGEVAKGKVAATGVYLYRLEAGDFVSSKKMLLLK